MVQELNQSSQEVRRQKLIEKLVLELKKIFCFL